MVWIDPELLQQLSEEDPSRAMELLQYVLNTKEERRVMDSVGEAVRRLGGTVMTYEHDGLFVHAPGLDVEGGAVCRRFWPGRLGGAY